MPSGGGGRQKNHVKAIENMEAKRASLTAQKAEVLPSVT
jgi:hypothetical protein